MVKKTVKKSEVGKDEKKASPEKKKIVYKETPKTAAVYINPKNYLYAFLILVGGILLAVYIFSWYNVKKEERLMVSYLISSNTIENSIADLNSLSQIRQEAPSSYFIYISYTGDEEVYNLEKGLKKLIDKYGINDIFYYVNLTDLKDKNTNYLEEIAHNLEISSLANLPAIIYVKDGNIVRVLDGVNNTKLTTEHFKKLLDEYDFEIIEK